MQNQAQFDIIIENGTVIDPANDRNGKFDVAISDGKIAAVDNDLSQADLIFYKLKSLTNFFQKLAILIF